MSFFTEGFEVGDDTFYETNRGWSYTGATTGVTNTAGTFHQSAAGKGGSWGLHIEDDAYTPAFGTGGRWINFWLGPLSPGNFMSVVARRLASDNAAVRIDYSGAITIRRGGGTSTIVGFGQTGSMAVPHWISIEIVADNTVGACTVYIDGVLSASVSGIDLQATGTSDWDQIRFGGSANANYDIDDLIITTAGEGRLDEHFILPQLPDGNDVINSEATSTGGAGDYTNVDELVPDDNTTYNEFTVTNTDRYTTANIGWTPESVHSVTVIPTALVNGSLTAAQAVCATDTGGGGATEALGTAVGVSAGDFYGTWQEIFNVDPDTASAWTSAGLDDLRIGIRFS